MKRFSAPRRLWRTHLAYTALATAAASVLLGIIFIPHYRGFPGATPLHSFLGLTASSSASPSAQTADISATPVPATTATFSSDQLGVSFTYATTSLQDPIATQQVDNRV
jgi:hypothetical protein